MGRVVSTTVHQKRTSGRLSPKGKTVMARGRRKANYVVRSRWRYSYSGSNIADIQQGGWRVQRGQENKQTSKMGRPCLCRRAGKPQKPQSPSSVDHQRLHAASTQRTHVFRWSGRGTKTFSTQRLTPTSSSRPTTTSSSERPGWQTRATTPAWPKTSSLAAKAPRRRCSCMVSDDSLAPPVLCTGLAIRSLYYVEGSLCCGTLVITEIS